MRLYHFLKAEHALSAIRDQQIKIARIAELNDPFEHIHFDTTNYVTHAVLKERKRKSNQKFGLICLSARFDDPVQWAHYGDSHRGVCLGFEVTTPDLIEVQYLDSRTPPAEFLESLALPIAQFCREAISKKFKHWEYEQEYRIIVPARKTTDLIFHPFSEYLRLTEVLIGARSNLSFARIRPLLEPYAQRPGLSKMQVSSSKFTVDRLE